MLILMISVGIISFGEILVIPIAYSACSEMSARVNDVKLMSLIPLSYAMATAFGGGVGKIIAKLGYDFGFLIFAMILLVIGSLFAGYSIYRGKRQVKI